jgi:hypothetical protein
MTFEAKARGGFVPPKSCRGFPWLPRLGLFRQYHFQALRRGFVPTQKPRVLQEVFNLEEGPVTLTFPASLSGDSYQGLADHLANHPSEGKTPIRGRGAREGI